MNTELIANINLILDRKWWTWK